MPKIIRLTTIEYDWLSQATNAMLDQAYTLHDVFLNWHCEWCGAHAQNQEDIQHTQRCPYRLLLVYRKVLQ